MGDVKVTHASIQLKEHGNGVWGSIALQEKIELSSELPPDIKPAIKEWVSEYFDQLKESVINGSFADLLPPEFVEHIDTLINIINSLI